MPAQVIVHPIFHALCESAGTAVVTTVARDGEWGGLSPFRIGPCYLYDGIRALKVENAWQFSKVYSEFVGPDNDILPGYWDWAERGWGDIKAHRYPMGKGRKPKFSYWDGDRLGYVDARKRIYVPLYAEAVQKTEAWQKLKTLYRRSKKLILLDYDAYRHEELGMSLRQVLLNSTRKMGHAFVLAMLLQQDKALDLCEMR